MFDKIKTTLSSREFQTGAGKLAIAVTSIIVAQTVANLTANGMMTGLNALMDKVHGKVVTPTTE